MQTRLTAIASWLLSWLAITAAAELNDGCPAPGGTNYTVHLEDDVSAELKAASVAAGLINRHMQALFVINPILPADLLWLASANHDATMSGCAAVALSVVEHWQLA
ncbi:TPA: hypothetical protein ACH3X1_010577 [Trebouxia sp. C0004]